jgi:hypothetical protein
VVDGGVGWWCWLVVLAGVRVGGVGWSSVELGVGV